MGSFKNFMKNFADTTFWSIVIGLIKEKYIKFTPLNYINNSNKPNIHNEIKFLFI